MPLLHRYARAAAEILELLRSELDEEQALQARADGLRPSLALRLGQATYGSADPIATSVEASLALLFEGKIPPPTPSPGS